jgi:pimeloyl-ACP methyl ester carboxylesterase
MSMHYIRRGAGRPLLLLHGIGGSWRSWQTILDELAAERDVIVVDLPGFDGRPPLEEPVTISALADAVTSFLTEHSLLGIDAVGNSMGATLVLELAQRGGVVGAVVALDPAGFWQGWELPLLYCNIWLARRVVMALQPVMPALTRNALTRSLLLAQYSAHPWQIPANAVLDEMHTYANAPSFDALLAHLAYSKVQQGAPKGFITKPLVIGWGRQDRVCFPFQARKALKKFPDARLYWFENCGHIPQWDQPAETIRLILAATSGLPFLDSDIAQRPPALATRKPVPQLALAAGVAAVVAGGLWLLLRRKHEHK